MDVRSALPHEIDACDAAVDDAVLHVLGHVGCAHEQHFDRGVAARKRKRAVSRLLRAQSCILEEMKRRLAEAALGRDGDTELAGGALGAVPQAPARSRTER